MQAAMAAKFPAVVGAPDRAGRIRDVGAEEIPHLHLADEANALAVLLVRGGQAGLAGKAAQRRLRQVADREARKAELCLREHREEIGLVLVFIEALEQGELG